MNTLPHAVSLSSRAAASAAASGGGLSGSRPTEQRSFCRRASASVTARVRLESWMPFWRLRTSPIWRGTGPDPFTKTSVVVAPARGAWIETPTRAADVRRHAESPPARGRGLKLARDRDRPEDRLSPPRGAWIETSRRAAWASATRRVAPARGRGLKLAHERSLLLGSTRRPQRERGLKKKRKSQGLRTVSPSAGRD